MKHEKLNEILSELRARLKENYGDRLVDVLLFGSQARGDAVNGSDIDVMVILKGEIDQGKEIWESSEYSAAISLEHDVLISTVFVSDNLYHRAQTPFLINARREAVRV